MTTLGQIGPGHGRQVLGVIASAAVVGAGVLLLLGDLDIGIAAICVGGASLAWTVAGLQDARTLSVLDDMVLGDLAVPLPLLPMRSSNPRRDIAWLPADVPALVALPDGGWGLVAHDTAVAASERVGFNGEWHRVAEPKEVFAATDSVPTIQRIPRGGDAALVDTEWPIPHGVVGTTIRDLAERRAESHADRTAGARSHGLHLMPTTNRKRA